MSDQNQQEKPKQILIIGSPRSGTSLLQVLVAYCFKGCWMPPEFEQRPSNYFWTRTFPTVDPKPEVVVWKVPEMPWREKEQFDKLIQEETHVIGIARHPASMLTSKQGEKPYWSELAFGKDRKTALERWQAMATYMMRFAQGVIPNFSLVRFEDLLSDPLGVQRGLSERIGLEPLHPFTEHHLHVPPNNPNVHAMNGLRPLDPKRAAQANDEELRKLGFEIPSTIRIMARGLGYDCGPLHELPNNVEIKSVGLQPYAFGCGQLSPNWEFHTQRSTENQLDLTPLLHTALAATIGEGADETFKVEGPCILPGHDHAMIYYGRGNAPLLVGKCGESGDYVMLQAGAGQLDQIKSLPPAPDEQD